MKKKYLKYFLGVITYAVLCFYSIDANAQTPSTMGFGNSTLLFADATNPAVDQSISPFLNQFDMSAEGAFIKLALAQNGNDGGTDAIGGPSDAVLVWLGDGGDAITSGTLSTDSGGEIGLTSMAFAFANSVGTNSKTFTIAGKRNGVVVGTIVLTSASNDVALNVNFTIPTSGSFKNIDELVITPDTPLFGGFSIDDLVVVTAITTPEVTSVGVPAIATYVAGQVLDFTVNFTENVTVNTAMGTPQLSVTIGATTRQASYVSGSGSSALLFRYVVQSGELDSDGITVGSLATNGGTLKSAFLEDANLTLYNIGSTTAVLVDAVVPTVSSVTVPADATYVAGQNLDFTINFSENVTVNTGGGTPQMSLTIGTTTRQAVYQSGTGTTSLLFRYTVQTGDLDSDGIAVGSLAANGGTLRDNASNNATLTLNSVSSTANVNVDAVVPTVTSVTVPAPATYAAGQNLDFTINFSENVTVNTGGGTPQMSLTIGATTRQAVYQSGTGTGALLFRYTVQTGESDSDGIAVGALSANGGTIRDGAANSALVTLNSVATTTAILIDAVAPTVLTKNLTVQLNASGTVSIIAADIDNGSTDNVGIAGMSLDKTTFSCSDIGNGPVSFTTMGSVSQNTHSVGSGYNPNTNEFWYPEWYGSTVYKYNASHNAAGSFIAPVSQIMQLWMDKSSSDYYTANWSSQTISRISSAGSIVWTYNMGAYAGTVTTNDLYVFAVGSGSNTIVVLDKVTGTFVKNISLPGSFSIQGGLVFANGVIYIAGFDMDGISTVPGNWNAIHAFDASTGAYISSVATAIATYGGVAFDGQTIWVSNYGNVIHGYKIANSNAYDNSGSGNRVKLTVTDNSGNTAFAFATVTVKDLIVPVIASNGDKNVNTDLNVCGAAVVVSATATDNCTVGTPTGVRSDALALDAVYPVGTTTIKWNVADANSNDAVEVTQTIVVTDNQLPVIVSNGDKNVIATVNTCGATVVVSATATDNCTVGSPTGVRSDALVIDAVYPVGTTTIKWNVADANNNDAIEVIQTIIVTDNQLPVIVSNGDKNVNTDLDVCGATIVVSATATDNCTVGTPTGVRSDALALDALYPVGTTTIAWNVADANTNDAVEVTQTIVVTDNQLPVIVSNGDKNVNTDLDICGARIVVSASATDNCTVGTPVGVRSDALALSALYPVGTTTIAWNVADANTNDAVTVTQTIVVTDNQLPIIVSNGDKNVNTDLDICGALVVVSASATDNCTVGSPTGVRSDALALDAVYPVGTTTIAWNVADANNNDAIEVIQTIIVTDNELPVVITKNITLQLDAAGNASIVAADVNNGSTDNCGISLVELDKTSFTCANVGANTVTLKITDNNGNVATQTAIVTVEDKVAPVAVTKNRTVQLDVMGNASIVIADVNNGSTDNCGIATLVLDKTSFSCSDVGANTVTLKVTDVNGNVTTKTAIVTVEDKIAPIVITKNITVQLDASSNVIIAAADVNNGSTDNCGISSLELDRATFSCANVGDNTVTLKVTDNSGNVSTKTAIVTVVDSQPNLIRKHFDDVLFFDNSSNAFIGYSWYKNGLLVPSQTAQYFKDNGVLDGTYYAIATKVDGTVVTTCPMTFSPSVEVEYLKIAPNPVRSNSSYQIFTNVDSAKLQNARITVFNILGTLIMDSVIDKNEVEMVAPSVEGIYIVKMTLTSGKYFTKNLLVRN